MKTETLTQNFGRVVAMLRASKGITQGILAKRAKLHYASVISNIERGQANPTLETLHAVAKGLDTKLSALLKLAEHQHGPAAALREL